MSLCASLRKGLNNENNGNSMRGWGMSNVELFNSALFCVILTIYVTVTTKTSIITDIFYHHPQQQHHANRVIRIRFIYRLPCRWVVPLILAVPQVPNVHPMGHSRAHIVPRTIPQRSWLSPSWTMIQSWCWETINRRDPIYPKSNKRNNWQRTHTAW